MASSSTSAQTGNLTLFARGVLAVIELWPALRLAVAEEWGGPDSADKRTWIGSAIIDLFEPALLAPPADGVPPIDLDDLADMLLGMIEDEFETDLEDGSPESVAKDILNVWKEVLAGSDGMVRELEALVDQGKGKKVQATGHHTGEELDEEEDYEDSEDEDEDMEDVDLARKVLDKQPPPEPVVDEDGFTLVQKGKGRR